MLNHRQTFIFSLVSSVGSKPRHRITDEEWEMVKLSRMNSGENVLVIGDLHEPFCLPEYLGHCQHVYNLYNCSRVIFIGDVIDNHYSSFHETDPDGMSGGGELDLAIKRIAKWYKAFPKAHVIIGNHDRLIMRKAFSGAIPKAWIKEYNEVLGVPGWKFVDHLEVDGVLYIHGETGTARTKTKAELQSVVQGHLHSQSYVEWFVGGRYKIFSMQVGCGIDRKSYAMAYAKAGKKPAIGCGVITKNGQQAFNIMMDL